MIINLHQAQSMINLCQHLIYEQQTQMKHKNNTSKKKQTEQLKPLEILLHKNLNQLRKKSFKYNNKALITNQFKWFLR